MRSPLTRFSAAALTLVLGFVLTVSVKAEPRTTLVVPVAKKRAVAGAGAVGVPQGGPNAIAALDQAYGLLRAADHDYKGHRAHAMHAIEAAVRELGARISGDGRGKENQGESDSQLRSAQSLLTGAIGELAGKPHRHIEEAIKQLGIALSVK